MVAGRIGFTEEREQCFPVGPGEIRQVDQGHVQSVHCGQRNPVP
jgi:hypothetical protein